MKTILKAIKLFCRVILIIALLIILFLMDACGQVFSFELMNGGSLNSLHAIKDENTNEDNGGQGFKFSFSVPGLHLGFFRYEFTNSYNDPGTIEGVELGKFEQDFYFIKGGITIWKSWVYGYKDDNGELKVDELPPLPKFDLGINPLYFVKKNKYSFILDNIWFNWHWIYLFNVRLTYNAIEFRYKWRF